MNFDKNLEILENEVLKLLDVLEGYITYDDEKQLREFISHNECGLAYEEIIETINFHSIPISLDCFNQIIKVGAMMDYNEGSWSKLKHLISK